MSNMTKTIAILGVVAGLGVAALPLSTYAATTPQTQNVPVKLEVAEVLQITTKYDTGAETTTPAAVELTTANAAAPANYASDGKFNIVVKSNVEKGYTLAIKGTTDITGATGITGAAVTDLLSSTDRIAAGDLTGSDSTWAYQAGTKTAWTAVTPTDETIYTGSKTVAGDLDITNGKAIPVKFGANVVSSQAAGVYNGQVTFTATANS